MADDVGDWLSNCTTCMKRKSPAGRHHPLGNISTGHRWHRIAMDILDVCDPTPDGYRYILVIADYFSKWTEAFPIKDKCADTVADVLVDKIILRFGMPLVIHSDKGREFENGLMKSLCTLLGCVKTRTAPYHPESDGMVERFNRTCLMMLSMFVNDRRDNWYELLPFVMYLYLISVHESTGYSPFRLMMREECSLPQDVTTEELRASREHDVAPHPFAVWVRDALDVDYDQVRHSLHHTAAPRKRLCDVKAVNRKFPVGSWVLRYYRWLRKSWDPLGLGHSKWFDRLPATSLAYRKDQTLLSYSYTLMTSNCPAPRDIQWTPGPSTSKSLCASTVAFRPGSHASESESTPSVIVSTWKDLSTPSTSSEIRLKLDNPNDLTGHLLSPFFVREFHYQGCRFHSIAHLMCYRYAIIHDLKLFATSIRKWSRYLTDFSTNRFQTPDWQVLCRTVLSEIYSHLCLTDAAAKTALIDTGPRPFDLQCSTPWGGGGGSVTLQVHAELLLVTFSSRHVLVWSLGD